MEEADLSLLPLVLIKTTLIVSVVLKYKNENPTLLTSDNMLQTRAAGLGITAISLKDFISKGSF